MSEAIVGLVLPPELVEAIVAQVTERVLAVLGAEQGNGSPWLSGAGQAAEYLGWPRERVYKRLGELPHFRDDGRLMFNKRELDRFVEERRERT